METFGDLIRLKGSKIKAKKYIWKKSRSIYINSDKPHQCERCGCRDCFEVDHIKPLMSFTDSCKLEDIMNINNLQALCPTCHTIKTLQEDYSLQI